MKRKGSKDNIPYALKCQAFDMDVCKVMANKFIV